MSAVFGDPRATRMRVPAHDEPLASDATGAYIGL